MVRWSGAKHTEAIAIGKKELDGNRGKEQRGERLT